MSVATVSVPSGSSAWVDTGLVLGGGATLYCCASGTWSQGPGTYCFPEGAYGADPTNPAPTYAPEACITTHSGFPTNWACSNTRPFSLTLAVRADGSGPPGKGTELPGEEPAGASLDEGTSGAETTPPPGGGASSTISDGLQANRANSFPGVGPGRVWAIVNDLYSIYTDNVGNLSLKVGDEPVSCGSAAGGYGLANDAILSGMVMS